MSPLCCHGKDLTGGDAARTVGGVEQQCAVRVEIEKAAGQGQVFEADTDLGAETGGGGEPSGAHRGETAAPPNAEPGVEMPDEGRHRRSRRNPASPLRGETGT